MKYRDITLNSRNNFKFKLVKYNKDYELDLSKFYKPNEKILDCVRTFPTIYSELSEEQSYIILDDNDSCIGIIVIGTSCDEKNLEISLQIDYIKFLDERKAYFIINEIVDALGFCFCDKKRIEITTDIDLCKYDSKYEKRFYDKNVIRYIYQNKVNEETAMCNIQEKEEENNYVKIDLTTKIKFKVNQIGIMVLERRMQESIEKYSDLAKKYGFIMPRVDENGYMEMELSDFILYFGDYCFCESSLLPFEPEFLIKKDSLQSVNKMEQNKLVLTRKQK